MPKEYVWRGARFSPLSNWVGGLYASALEEQHALNLARVDFKVQAYERHLEEIPEKQTNYGTL